MVFSRQSLVWASGSPWERQSTLNPTDVILNLCHIFPSARRRFPPGKEKKSSNLENLLNPMACKGWRWESHGYFCLVFPWISSSSSVIAHLADLSGGTVPSEDMESLTPSSVIVHQPLYRNAEPQDVFSAPLTCSDYLAELTQNEGDFFSNQQACLCMSMEATQNRKSLWAKMQWSMRWAPSLHGSLA